MAVAKIEKHKFQTYRQKYEKQRNISDREEK